MAGVQWNLLQQPAPQPPINILDSFHQGVGQMQKMRMNDLAMAKGAQDMEYNPQKLYSQELERQSRMNKNIATTEKTELESQKKKLEIGKMSADEIVSTPPELIKEAAIGHLRRNVAMMGGTPEQLAQEEAWIANADPEQIRERAKQASQTATTRLNEMLGLGRLQLGAGNLALSAERNQIAQGQLGVAQQNAATAQGNLAVNQQNAATNQQRANNSLLVTEMGANRPRVANLIANGWMPSQRMTKPMLDTIEAAATEAEKNGLPFNPDDIRAYEFQAQKNKSLGATAGSRLVTARKENIDTAQMLLGRMQETAKELNFSDFKIAGIAEKFVKGQLNDPVLTRYMTQRADALFALGNALKQNGITDKAIQVEEEAANPTVSPKAFDAWYRVQMEALKDAGAALKKDYEPAMPNRQQAVPAPASFDSAETSVKTTKNGTKYRIIEVQ